MNFNPYKRLFQYFQKNPTFILSLIIILSSFTISLLFPVYFREDDTEYLTYAHQTTNFFLAFVPSKAIIQGMFRPVQNMTWWLLFRFFGLNPFPYQLFCTLLYGFSFVFFFKLIERLFNKKIAVFTLISYLCLFYSLCYIIFWFSDLTYILELFFMNLSLYLLVKSIQDNRGYIWGVLFYLVAVLSKEPAAMIVPLGTLCYLWSDWNNLAGENRKRLILVFSLCLFGILYILLNPYVKGRQGFLYFSEISEVITFVSERWFIYSDYLISETGLLLWLATIYWAIRLLFKERKCLGQKRFGLILCFSIAVSLVATLFQEAALPVLFLALIVIFMKRTKASVGSVWFTFSLLGILFIQFIVRTLLIEASFGIVIIVGVALFDIFNHLKIEWQRWPKKYGRTVGIILGGAILLGTALFGIPLFNKYLGALRVLSANRQNFKDAVRYVIDNEMEESSRLLIVDYEVMGFTHEDIVRLPNREKAHRQKTMVKEDVQRLLNIMDRENIIVGHLGDYLASRETEVCYLLVMNNYEDHFLKSIDINKTNIYETKKYNECAKIYRLR